MPWGDGTGPSGKGPGTGRGMGGCSGGQKPIKNGIQKGARFFGGVDFNELAKRDKFSQESILENKQQQLDILQHQARDLQNKMDEIQSRINDIQKR